jgi:hypothetical protein
MNADLRRRRRLRLALHPPPELGQRDTSLRYTDILFGFVIKELFVRIQNWPQLNTAVRWHLVVGTILVLGSWIGFRRSVYRPAYEVKFFNLPLFKFIIDQAMLILYFRIAVLTTVEGKELQVPEVLARDTNDLVVWIFVLYVVWDVLGLWMATATKAPVKPVGKREFLYPIMKDDKPQTPNWSGFFISAASLSLLAFLRLIASCLSPSGLFLGIAAVLLGYRWAKEMRTSWSS